MLLLLACAPLAPTDLTHPDGPTAYDVELHELTRQADVATARADAMDDWTADQLAVGVLMQRARLTGAYDDYALAQDLLSDAFALAPEGSGPLLTRAGFNLSLHRVDRVLDDVETAESAVLIDDYDRAAFALVRGNVAFQTGDYDAALDLYDASIDLHPTVGAYAARSNALFWLGDEAGSEADCDAAEALYHGTWGEPAAWFDLQRGLRDLERGRYDQALAHYDDAADHLGGYWLVEEHIAEILALTGDTEGARAIYQDVVDRTGHPELLGALAEVDPAQADALIARADAAYAARMQTFPEATWGHALDHALAWGDPADALDMALANATLRPHGAPQIQLAQAWLLHDDPARALDALTPALDAGWASADLHVVAADAHHALGDADAAHAHCAQAQALNPSASCSQR